MENARFITSEDGDDLVVSFAIPASEPGDVKSLTLLRTPKYESLLDEPERGVKVSYEDFPDDRDELLEKLRIAGDMVTIKTDYGTHSVSIASVDQRDIEDAKAVLRKMNFDRRFQLEMS